MRFATVYVLFALICLCQAGRLNKKRTKKCFNRKPSASGYTKLFGVRTLYENYERVYGSAFIQRPSPESNCVPVHMYLLLRHGARYPHTDTIKEQKKLLRLTKLINSTGTATLCSKHLQQLQAWKPWVDKYVDKNQTSYGDDEVRNISKRFATSFPELFPSQAQPGDYRFRSSNYQRTIASMRVFAEEVFKRGRSEAGTIEEAVERAHLVVPAERDTLLRVKKNCKNFKNASGKIELSKFLEGKLVKRMLRFVTSRLGLRRGTLSAKDLYRIYLDGCSLQQWVDTKNGPWCLLFSKKDLRVLEYAAGLKVYGLQSRDIFVNQLSCLLAKDVTSALKTASESVSLTQSIPKGTFRFGHVANVFSLAASMQFHKRPVKAKTGKGYKVVLSRLQKFNLSKMIPSAANLAFILYKCNHQYKVQVYWNEKLQSIPACANSGSPTLCDLTTFMSFYKDFVAGSSTECSYAELCG